MLQFYWDGIHTSVLSQADGCLHSCLGFFKIHHSILFVPQRDEAKRNGGFATNLTPADFFHITVSGDFAPGAFLGKNVIIEGNQPLE